MLLNIPTNWDTRLLDGLYKLPVSTIYGRLPWEVIGGGRPGAALPYVSRQEAEAHIAQVRRLGLDFNYVLNAPCLGNIEYDPKTRKSIRELLDWMCESGVSSTTVTVPYLIEIIKRHYPQLRVVASVFCHIDSIDQALSYYNLGVNEITIVQLYNRQFDFLSSLRDNLPLSCDLQIIVNNACLLGCPYRRYHANLNAHASQCGQPNLPFDYPVINCTRVRLQSPAEVIKSPWIRPEDLHYYEKIGIDRFKLSGRTKTTDWILATAKAYAKRQSPENFAQLLSVPNGYGSGKRKSYPGIPDVDLVIDNRALKDFLPFFFKKSCPLQDCDKCGYCARISQKAIRADKTLTAEAVTGYETLLEEHFSG